MSIPAFFLSQNSYSNFLYTEETPPMKMKTKTRRQLVMHRYYPSIANCRIKIPVIFHGTLRIFHGISTFLFTLWLLVEPWITNTALDGHVFVERNGNTTLDWCVCVLRHGYYSVMISKWYLDPNNCMLFRVWILSRPVSNNMCTSLIETSVLTLIAVSLVGKI